MMSLNTGSKLEQTKNNPIENIDYSHVFEYFRASLSACVEKTCEEFLKKRFNIYMISMNDAYDILFRGDEYFVTEVGISKDVSFKSRLSASCVETLLFNVFGSQSGEITFSLERISELEAKILTAFNNELYANLKSIFIPDEEIKKFVHNHKLKNNMLFFTFYLYDEYENYGKIILSIPEQILKPAKVLPPSKKKLAEKLFLTTPAFVDIFVGSTKSSLEELNKIEQDDIIVLDNSKIGSMYTGDNFEFQIKVKPDVSLVYEYDTGDDYGEDEDMPKKLSDTKMWDNIQVDVRAEFEKIKMPLGDLKQISEGLVVDLASVYRNKITLKVEDSKIAEGELVIIGDRYGVRLSAVYNQEEAPESKETKTAAGAGVKPSAKADKTEKNKTQKDKEPQKKTKADTAPVKDGNTDEDFDLDDFDIDEDEDI